MKLLDWPKPEIIPYLTPSTYSVFSTCALKGVLSRSEAYKDLLYVHPKARIGMVCHELLEKLGRGKFDQLAEEELTDQIDILFKQLCLEQFAAAARSVYEEKVTNPEKWPGYYIRLARLKLVGKKLWHDRKNSVIRQARQFVEHHMNVFDGKLKGRPDRFVFVSPNELLIEDYKTGLIYDDDSTLLETIKQQMLLYSAILYQTYPNCIIRFRIVPLKGASYEEVVDINEAKVLAQRALELLDQINAVLDGISTANSSFDEIAYPSIENCGNCPFKFRCTNFLESKFPDLRFHSFKGNLEKSEIINNFMQVTLCSDFNRKILVRRLPEEIYSYLKELKQSNIIVTELQKVSDQLDTIIFEPTFKTTIWIT